MLASSSAWDSGPTCVCLPLRGGIRVLQPGWLSVFQDRALCVCVGGGVRVSVKQWFSVFASLCPRVSGRVWEPVPLCGSAQGARVDVRWCER